MAFKKFNQSVYEANEKTKLRPTFEQIINGFTKGGGTKTPEVLLY